MSDGMHRESPAQIWESITSSRRGENNLNETITWVPVNERLPEDDRLCIIIRKDYVTAARYFKSKRKWVSDCGDVEIFTNHEYPITHWVGMPKGPITPPPKR